MRYQKVMKIGLFGLLIMSLFFLTGCFGFFMDWFAPPPEEVEVIIPETTKVVDQETIEELYAVIDDGAVLTFDVLTPFLDQLRPDDVMVWGITDKTPYGLLRKVTEVREVDGKIIVETIQATLEDAITQGVIEFTIPITPDNAVAAPLKEGVSIMSAGRGSGWTIRLDDVRLPHGIDVTGYIHLEPEIHFRRVFHWLLPRLEELYFRVELNKTAQLEVSSTRDTPIDERVKVGWWAKTFIAMVGKLPVVVTPTLTVHVGLDGRVSADINASARQEMTAEAGVRFCRNWGWRRIRDLHHSSPQYQVSAQADAEVQVYAEPRFELWFYHVVATYAIARGYLEADVDLDRAPWWKLYGGIEAGVGARAEALGWEIGSWSDHDILDMRWRIAEAPPKGDVTPPTINSFTVKPNSITKGNSVAIRFAASDNIGGSGIGRIILNRAVGKPENWETIGWYCFITHQSYGLDVYDFPWYNGELRGFIQDIPPSVGTFWYGLRIEDKAGNHNCEQNSQTNNQPGIFGPDRVTVIAPLGQPPIATIIAPLDGLTFTHGDLITFQGSATDPEDGTLTGAALVWTSSADGQIGMGESFTRDDLSVGTHTITLTATDRQGAVGMDSITVTITVAAVLKWTS